MANQVASKNSFALLNDDGGDVSQDPSPPTAAPAEAPKPNQKKSSSARGGRYYQRGGARPAPSTETQAPVEEKKYNRGDRADRGERGGRGGPRGRGRGRGGDRDARPDRHSATGIVDSQKKYHQGWGGDRGDTELKDETNGANDAAAGDGWGAPAATAGDGWDAPAPAAGADDPWATPAGETGAGDAAAEGDNGNADDKQAEGDRPRKKWADDDEDENKMTLDEYRAKNTAAGSEIIPKLEIRKVGDTTSDFFKGAVQLTKDVEANNYFVGKQTKAGGAPKARKEGKQYIEIEARFDPPSRGGRGRGRGRGDRGEGRGGYRGDRGDRGSRNKPQQPTVDMEDPNAFPAL